VRPHWDRVPTYTYLIDKYPITCLRKDVWLSIKQISYLAATNFSYHKCICRHHLLKSFHPHNTWSHLRLIEFRLQHKHIIQLMPILICQLFTCKSHSNISSHSTQHAHAAHTPPPTHTHTIFIPFTPQILLQHSQRLFIRARNRHTQQCHPHCHWCKHCRTLLLWHKWACSYWCALD
jgi:hypothetical protein